MDNPNGTVLPFEKVYNKCHSFLKYGGILIKKDDENHRRVALYKFYYYFTLSWVSRDMVAEVALFVRSLLNEESFTELTNLAPCILMGVVASTQSVNFRRKIHVVQDLLKSILSINTVQETFKEKNHILKTEMNSVSIVINLITTITSVGLALFALNPFFKIIRQYYSNDEIYFTLPFLVLYPFDIQIFRNWVIAYIHVMFSGMIQALFFVSPYYLCYTCTAVISCQFNFLCEDIRILISYPYTSESEYVDENILRLKEIAKRHKELIRCVDLMEEIFSFSNLLHLVASSILICLTAFNVMMLNDIILVLPFLQFLCLCLGQIFFICYYGDLIMRSSVQISDALYECQWYNADERIVKKLLIMFIRAQKPCKITAYGFSDINLNVFARILSTSASYFTLLRTMYLK